MDPQAVERSHSLAKPLNGLHRTVQMLGLEYHLHEETRAFRSMSTDVPQSSMHSHNGA